MRIMQQTWPMARSADRMLSHERGANLLQAASTNTLKGSHKHRLQHACSDVLHLIMLYRTVMYCTCGARLGQLQGAAAGCCQRMTQRHPHLHSHTVWATKQFPSCRSFMEGHEVAEGSHTHMFLPVCQLVQARPHVPAPPTRTARHLWHAHAHSTTAHTPCYIQGYYGS